MLNIYLRFYMVVRKATSCANPLKKTRYFAPLAAKIKILSVTLKPLFVNIALTAVLALLPLSDLQADPA
jgi:hypothetical protein